MNPNEAKPSASMNLCRDYVRYETRRKFFSRGANAVGWAALSSLVGKSVGKSIGGAFTGFTGGGLMGAEPFNRGPEPQGPGLTHFPPRAKQVIYLHMVGGPGQMDLYDYKPVMQGYYDKDLPETVRMGQRLTTMTSGQARFPIAPSMYQFAQYGKSGMWVSELLPWTA